MVLQERVDLFLVFWGMNVVRDHVHRYLSVPSNPGIVHAIGFLKVQSAVLVHHRPLHEYRITGVSFMTTGYCVRTLGLDEKQYEYVCVSERL